MSQQQDDHVIQKDDPPQPPEAPSIDRHVKQYSYQWIGIPLIILIPVLALFNVFGTSRDSAQAANDALALRVTYPERMRYKMLSPLEVSITNLADSAMGTLQVKFEESYIEQFSTVNFTPSIKMVTDSFYIVELKDVQPGETRLVKVSLQGEHYWRQTGHVRAAADGVEPVDVTVSTIVFP